MTKYLVINISTKIKTEKVNTWLTVGYHHTKVVEKNILESFNSYTEAVLYQLELENRLPNEIFDVIVTGG